MGKAEKEESKKGEKIIQNNDFEIYEVCRVRPVYVISHNK